VLPFISPLAPFLDPGSEVFENPQENGYSLFCKSVQEHYQAMESPSWQYMLNYETKWMNRSEIVHSTYEAALTLNKAKGEYSLIPRRIAQSVENRTEYAIQVMKYIEEVVTREGVENGEALLALAADKMANLNRSTVCEKAELEWPAGLIRMNPWKIAKTLMSYR
jgi:hypothetical protein